MLCINPGYVSKCTFWELRALSTGCSVVRDQAKFIRGWDRCISILPLKKSLSHVQYTGLWFNIYEKKLHVPCLISMKILPRKRDWGPMKTKSCKNIFVPWPFALVPIAWSLRGEFLFQINVVWGIPRQTFKTRRPKV